MSFGLYLITASLSHEEKKQGFISLLHCMKFSDHFFLLIVFRRIQNLRFRKKKFSFSYFFEQKAIIIFCFLFHFKIEKKKLFFFFSFLLILISRRHPNPQNLLQISCPYLAIFILKTVVKIKFYYMNIQVSFFNSI